MAWTSDKLRKECQGHELGWFLEGESWSANKRKKGTGNDDKELGSIYGLLKSKEI